MLTFLLTVKPFHYYALIFEITACKGNPEWYAIYLTVGELIITCCGNKSKYIKS